MINAIWRRRHMLSRMEVDEGGWKHPRPPADPRLVMIILGFAWISFAQTLVVRPDSSVAARAWTTYGAMAVALLIVLCCAIQLRAVFCKSQFSSWGWESAACVGFAGQAIIQFQALVSVQPEWWASQAFIWSGFWGIGNAWRAAILLRRLW